MWAFKTFKSATGRTDVQDEIDEADVEVVVAFEVRLRYLSNTPKIDWKRPQAAKLSGVKDVYEIRFQGDGKQYRPLGYFGPGPNEFTILIWAYKKQDVYNPADAIKSAEKRKKSIEDGKASCSALQIDGADYWPFEE